MSEDELAIRSVVAAWFDAIKRYDTRAVLDLMTEDALFMVTGQPPMTKVAFEAASKAQAASKISIEGVSDIQDIHVEGSMAYIVSRLSITVRPGGESAPFSKAGHTLTIFRKVGGHWLLSRDANLLVKS